MNKVLIIRGVMTLPDDFTGTLGDGLQLLADLRKKEEQENPDILKIQEDPQHVGRWNGTFVELFNKQQNRVEMTLAEIKHEANRMSLSTANSKL